MAGGSGAGGDDWFSDITSNYLHGTVKFGDWAGAAGEGEGKKRAILSMNERKLRAAVGLLIPNTGDSTNCGGCSCGWRDGFE